MVRPPCPDCGDRMYTKTSEYYCDTCDEYKLDMKKGSGPDDFTREHNGDSAKFK